VTGLKGTRVLLKKKPGYYFKIKSYTWPQ
jgi:hypothetical protein